MTVLSLGAGVQSTTLALLAVEGALPKPDAAIFADTGWEPAAVYEHLDRLEAAMSAAGIPVHRVQRGNLRSDSLDEARRVHVPAFVPALDGRGAPTARQCTRDYKLRPITWRIRELIGYPRPQRVPKGITVEQWIGFSTDEMQRVSGKSDSPFLVPRYPLLELDMSRSDCQRWLRARGWGETPKSACIGCPFHGNRMWREMRDQRPAEWADAVDFDAALRRRENRVGLQGDPYLHRSLLPLDQAPIDHVTRNEWHDRQTTIEDQIADAIAEDGDPDGCSPHGCRSGEPAA